MNDLQHRTGKYFQWLAPCLALVFLSFVTLKTSSPVTTAPHSLLATPSLITTTHFSPLTTHSLNTALSLADTSRLNLLYDDLDLDSLGLSPAAFHKAIAGFLSLVLSGEVHNASILSIIDFTLPSTQKRLFILDILNGRLLFNTLVAHGKNSGKLLANRFSNRNNSYMSSLGFYLTGEPFIGQHGYSLRLDGKEKGWNDNVFRRAIIMHPAGYVSEEHIRQWGYLGRSEGCPAIPEEWDRSIIDSIRGGSCLFIYGPDKKYLKRSRLLPK